MRENSKIKLKVLIGSGFAGDFQDYSITENWISFDPNELTN